MKIDDVTTDALEHYLSCLGVFQKGLSGGAQVILLGASCRCLVNIGQVTEGNGGSKVVANFAIDLGRGDTIQDLVIGFGPSVADAVVNSVDQFVGSIVAPIASLSGREFDREKWRCQATNFELPGVESDEGVGWNMATGQIVSNDAGGELYSIADERPPLFEIFTPIAQHIVDTADQRPHWVKIYLCRYPDGIDGEVRIDNQLHDQAFQTLRNFRWPSNQRFIWFRQFAILEPADETERRSFAPAQVAPLTPATRSHSPNVQTKSGSFLSKFLQGRR